MVHYLYHFDYSPNALERVRQATKHTDIIASDASEHSRAIVKFLMTGNSTVPVDPGPTATSEPAAQENYIVEHAKVFAVAVKHQVDGLRQLAKSKFIDETTKYDAWSHDNFAQAVSIVYNSTFDTVTELRDVVKELLHAHFEELERKPDIEAVVTSIPQLSYALLKRSHAKLPPTLTAMFRFCLFCNKGFPPTHRDGPGSDPVGYAFCSRACVGKHRARMRPASISNASEAEAGYDS